MIQKATNRWKEIINLGREHGLDKKLIETLFFFFSKTTEDIIFVKCTYFVTFVKCFVQIFVKFFF